MSKDFTLVVVESPSKSKTISKYLGDNYIVRPTVGHIVDLSKGKGDIGVNIENDFQPKYEDLADKKDVIQSIIKSAKGASRIIIASDPDREGEAIAFHVKNKLDKLNIPIFRAEFHEITKNGILKGLNSLRDLDQNLYNAQQARRVLDRIVGFMVSPYIINKFGDNLSAGRVQSVALRLIVDKEREIESFVPEDYWNINVSLSNGETFIANYPSKITSENESERIKSILSTASYVVDEVVAREQKRNPPTPLNTADLQKFASARFKFAADRTMKTAQSLYEMGAISYIRTDSYRSSPESIQEVRNWITENGFSIPKEPILYKNKDASQDAHEAIRPTDIYNIPDNFIGSDDQIKLYKLIWERFVASQMKPALYDTVSVTIKASNSKDTCFLKANGRVLKAKEWLEITYDPEKLDKDTVLPLLNENDNLNLVSPGVKVEKKVTKPPARFNDGSIIDELKKRGIGRPSTYAAILTKISARKYVDKIKNNFQPTEIGKKIIDDLNNHFSFMNYDYTALMEEDLDKMALGDPNKDYKIVMADFYKSFREEFQKAKNSTGRDAGINCPICNSNMTVRHSQYGFFAGCIKYPDCRGVIGIRLENDSVVVQEKHEHLDDVFCPKCNSKMVKRDGKFGPFYSCSNYPRCDGKRKIPFGKKCSKCNGELYLTIFNNETKLACMNYPNCKNVESVPEESPVDWVKPDELIPKKLPKKVEKVLKKKI